MGKPGGIIQLGSAGVSPAFAPLAAEQNVRFGSGFRAPLLTRAPKAPIFGEVSSDR